MGTYKKIFLSTLGLCAILGTTTFAANETDTRGINIALDNEIQAQVVDTRSETLQTALTSGSKSYDLRKEVTMPVLNQGSSENCWAMSLKTAFESTLKRKNNDNLKISAEHMAFATSNSFSDGTYKYGLERNAKDTATGFIGLGYLTNGSGPVDEFQMKFSDTNRDISVSEVENKTPLLKTEEWQMLSGIIKEHTQGTIKYKEHNLEVSQTKLNQERNAIKQHIKEYGAVTATIHMLKSEMPTYYNSETKSYYYDGKEAETHAITIIGWDDDYSKENFNAAHRPSSNGAYLVQNSYGDKNTYFYVSYEDTHIESKCIGITKINYINYYQLYQHDAQGVNLKPTIDKNEYYAASVFTRKDTNVPEYLDEVAITTLYSANYEIYVNPNSESLDIANFKKVKASVVPVTPGYYTIRFDSLELTGEKFAVVVKYTKVKNEAFGLTLLSNVVGDTIQDIWYSTIEKKAGECFIGASMAELQDSGIDGQKTCIKAFTKKIPKMQNISNEIKISSKNQGQSNNCWTMPATTVLETNMAMKNAKNGIFDTVSAKHMDYATSQSFLNGVFNRFGYERAVNTAGTMEWALAYFTNGMGPVSEISMPFSDTFGNINLSEITNKTVIAKVEKWIQFPEIIKTITDGKTTYTKENGTEYTQEELEAAREKIKLHIMQNGAISTEIYISGVDKYYNGTTNAYYCDNANEAVDHGVAIIGWDDDYSKENFNSAHRPSTDGAYIVQNSWGQDGEVQEQFYVSYEDLNIEKELYGIVDTAEKDNTETIYQYDELGRNTSIVTDGETYGANVFERDTTTTETLKEVAISTYGKTEYEIYVNPNSGDINSEEMILVAKSDEPVESGYHTVKFEPVELTGSKFAIAVKYMGTDNTLVAMQAKKNGAYSNITSNAGESYLGTSLDGMVDMKTMTNIPEGNLCIKAFTNKEGQTYSVLKGDANLDGKVTVNDVSLLKMHLVGLVYLQGYAYDAVDFNQDGQLTVTDLSMQMNYMVGM